MSFRTTGSLAYDSNGKGKDEKCIMHILKNTVRDIVQICHD